MYNIPDAKSKDVADFKQTPKYLLHPANKAKRQPVELSLLERFKLDRMSKYA